MSIEPEKSNVPNSFVRRHKDNICGLLCLSGDATVGLRGGFNHDGNVLWGGYEMMAGALNLMVGGPKLITTAMFTVGGIENLVSAARDIHHAGLTIDNGLQATFALAWTLAPVILFTGKEIAAKLEEFRPAARLRKILLAHHKQIGAALYSASSVVYGVESILAMLKGIHIKNAHDIKAAAIDLGSTVLFLSANTVVALKSPPQPEAIAAMPRPTRSAALRVLEL